MADTVRAAIFGNGFAREVILPCLRHVDGIDLVGISSPNVKRVRATAAEFGIKHASKDHREILSQARPDLVFVATPPHRHAEMALDALSHGCHVVCEKPAALNVEEAVRMLEAAQAAPDRLTLIDHELRFHPGRAVLKEVAASGRLGTIEHADYAYHATGRKDRSLPWTWWSDASQGGGILAAIGSHAVDALRLLLGEVVEVKGRLQTFTAERIDPRTKKPRPVTADELALARLGFASGATASLHLSTIETKRLHTLTLIGSEGTVQLDEQGPLRLSRGRRRAQEMRIDWGLPPCSELEIPDTDWAMSFLVFARRIAEALMQGKTVVPGSATFVDGHRTQIILDAIRTSATKGGWVEISEP